MDANKKLIFPAKLLPFLSEKDNCVISPYGILTVLSMAAEGANEECLKQILQALGFESLEELREAVLAVQDARCSAFTSDNNLALRQGEKKLELLSDFRKIMEERYNSSIEESSSDGEAALFLKNVANFKAEWFYEMERDASHKICFYNSDGSKSYPAFLSATQDYLRYYKGGKEDGEYTYVNAVAIPYKLNNERIPYELVLVEGNKELTTDVLENIFNNMRLKECKLAFPEFSIKNRYDLIPVMNWLGINTIFSQDFPAFDKIATEPLYAERFSQEAEIEVDKNGTVAKAVTDMDRHIGDFIDEPKEIVFNSPFHYFLRNTTTGEIIFMGKVNKLEDCEFIEPVDSVDLTTLFDRVIV